MRITPYALAHNVYAHSRRDDRLRGRRTNAGSIFDPALRPSRMLRSTEFLTRAAPVAYCDLVAVAYPCLARLILPRSTGRACTAGSAYSDDAEVGSILFNFYA